MSEIVIARHPVLIEYLVEYLVEAGYVPASIEYLTACLVESGYIPAPVEVVSHVSEEIIAGKHVFGVLPPRLAAFAASVTEVRQHAGKLTTYVVKED
jgi:hypothetical protein